ncbi:MAG: HDIG domain-containing protein [Treponema sp.]|jgi:putative nucleotidyltransferase with HDIG domain|nr:HDIG domain-containing protein [Treponema sp.]
MKIKLELLLIGIKTFLRSGPDLYSISLCVVTAILIITTGNDDNLKDINNFEIGKVADRDVIAGFSFSYIDEEATQIRLDMTEKQIPAVYKISNEKNTQIIDSWNNFCNFADKLSDSNFSVIRQSFETEYPLYFSAQTLNVYFNASERASFRNYGSTVLDKLLENGIIAFNSDDIKIYNPDFIELSGLSDSNSGHKAVIPVNKITTLNNIREAVIDIVKTVDTPAVFRTICFDLFRPFLTETAFFSPSETQKELILAKEQILPVIKNIDKGVKIVKRGFIITAAEMKELEMINYSYPGKDPRNAVGYIFFIVFYYFLLVILRGKVILGKKLTNNERYLMSSITFLYITGAFLLKNLSLQLIIFPTALAFPTALLIMILAVFMGTRPAFIMALALPIGAFFTGAFDFYSLLIALVSGITASTVLHNVQSRMGIIKTGLVIAVVNCLAVITSELLHKSDFYNYPVFLFWAALNGIISSMLTLGFLPPLEHALNAVTPFRLMELSDLNAPVLKKLFTAAPGTYNHSLMVANLAEQACQDICANALLARVGAYYHDIGKMENPDYFIENQTDHNRHDEIAPRLSATVIRSHVKLGIEKAQSLGLPKEVIDIIREHHGNSVISWFYNKAVEQGEAVNSEDFAYPGNPPLSRESAVVMLADITEAAVRSLIKPTAGKIEKFIQQLFESKVDHGQLSESALSFRDLEKIKKSFVRVLASYYHSRIEYPKQKEEAGE